VLPDGTIVSGDQRAAVQFGDGGFGTLLQPAAALCGRRAVTGSQPRWQQCVGPACGPQGESTWCQQEGWQARWPAADLVIRCLEVDGGRGGVGAFQQQQMVHHI